MMWTSLSASASPNRSALNGCGSMNESRSRNRSVISSPTAGACRKPCPENPVAYRKFRGDVSSADQGVVVGGVFVETGPACLYFWPTREGATTAAALSKAASHS